MAPLSHRLQDCRWLSTIMGFMYVLSLSLIASQEVSITIEAPLTNTTTAKISNKAVENFDTYSAEKPVANWVDYRAKFKENHWGAVYKYASTSNKMWQGGAGETGCYFCTIPDIPGYKLKIIRTTDRQEREPKFFGLYVFALKASDQLTFLYQKNPIFTTNMALILNKIPKDQNYWTNPSDASDKTKAFVFINFYLDKEYDEILFSSQNFCSDNHTFGRWKNVPGTVIHKEKLLTAETDETQG